MMTGHVRVPLPDDEENNTPPATLSILYTGHEIFFIQREIKKLAGKVSVSLLGSAHTFFSGVYYSR